MKYELAKELKDAGFPQPIGNYSTAVAPDGRMHPYNNKEGVPPKWAYAPTLSELIEACGEGFEYLNRVHGGGWFAGTQDDYAGTEQSIFQGEKGSTPEEAVARLWLALQKNLPKHN